MRHLEYRGFITGVLSVFCLYALISCWPAITALIRGQAQPVTPAHLVAGTPSSVAGFAGGAPAPASVARQPLPMAAPSVQTLRLDSEPSSAEPPADWQKARGDLVLLEKPGGVGLRPSSLCRAALTICEGAHLRVLDEEAGWVKVQSASRAVGWVRAEEMRAD